MKKIILILLLIINCSLIIENEVHAQHARLRFGGATPAGAVGEDITN